jgi:transcriptional regulator with XRE-family HTH domain
LSKAGQAEGSRAHRRRLGAELRRLRRLSGLSGREVAARIDTSQAHVSRVESGQAAPPLPQVLAWAQAVGARDAAQASLIALTEAALAEADRWGLRDESSLSAMQQDVDILEADAGASRHFQPAIVPGLLQTADYAKCVFEITSAGNSGEDHAHAVAARLDRQQILYRPGKRFEFLLTEAAVRLRIGPPRVLRGQAGHLSTLMNLDNIDIGVIPLEADVRVVPWCGFHLYYDLPGGGNPFVTIDLPHSRLTVADPGDVAIYQQQLDAARQSALRGQDARLLFGDLTRVLSLSLRPFAG